MLLWQGGEEMTRVFSIIMVWLTATLVLLPWSAPATAQGSAPAALFGPEELDQLVAPIALYPDSLLAQVLMASTYPLEIVSAARWVKANPKLKDQALDDALQTQTWDPSVKSLAVFPEVLTMMNEKLNWTQKLGDAFLAQQTDVMNAVQRLRSKAQAQGNLKTTQEQKVIVEPMPVSQTTQGQGVVVEPPAASQTMIIRIEPADPQVVYVPTYNPTVVYGAWPYPAYPPVAYYPPGYVAATSLLSFGAGVAVGAALWGDCNWGRGDVNINVNRYNNFNRTNITSGTWQHNVEHRKGVQYRDSVSQQKFNRTMSTGGDAREAFRGRAESGRQQLAHGGAEGVRRDLERANVGAERHDRQHERQIGDRQSAQGHRELGTRDRPAERRDRSPERQIGDRQSGQGHREPERRERPEAGRTAGRQLGQEQRQIGAHERRGTDRPRQAEAFQGIGNGPEVRRDSERGFASRQSATASRASAIGQGAGGHFGGGGGGRGGGGGHFGGGGGGRGGGRRR
jgi:hypothetical protein